MYSGAMIFFRRDIKEGPAVDLETRVNQAVFPACQGGPHNNAIAAIAVQMKEVASPEFKQYSKQIRANAVALATALMSKGYKLATDGTDNHLILWDLRPLKLSGSKFESLCDFCSITLNKNSINGDRSAITPGGVRVGTPALTSRGFVEADFQAIAEFLHR
jgi:glycine hydroxymethyltransferase